MTLPLSQARAFAGAIRARARDLGQTLSLAHPPEMPENWEDADPVFFTQAGRTGQRPVVAVRHAW